MAELYKDLLHPTREEQARLHKKKRLVQAPNSFFMDVKCPGCYAVTTVFSHVKIDTDHLFLHLSFILIS